MERTPATSETPVIIPLTAISDIGEARAMQLAEIGIDSMEKLAAAAPQNLARVEGISMKMAAQFIVQANELVAAQK